LLLIPLFVQRAWQKKKKEEEEERKEGDVGMPLYGFVCRATTD
jgi:hypothetical protein